MDTYLSYKTEIGITHILIKVKYIYIPESIKGF